MVRGDFQKSGVSIFCLRLWILGLSVLFSLGSVASAQPALDRAYHLTRFEFSLSDESQLIQSMRLRDFYDAFSYLARLNNGIEGLQNFYQDQAHFVRLITASPHPILFKSGQDAVFSDGRNANRFKGLDVIATIQTNRPPGYLHETFDTADAVETPAQELFYMIFAKRPPPALQDRFDSQFGEAGKDYICIYFVPPYYDWNVGQRLPLMPFALPLSRLKELGLTVNDLDFNQAQFIGQKEAEQRFEQSQNLKDLIEPGLHIPFRKNSSSADTEVEELFLPLSHLQRTQRTLVNLFETSVGLSDPQNFEEQQSRVNQLSEDLAALNFENMEAAENFGSSVSILINEVLETPPWIPNEDRARNLQISTRGPTSTITRAAMRAPERSEALKLAKWTKQTLLRSRAGAQEPLRRQEEKSLEQDQSEWVEAIDGFLEMQNHVHEQARSSDDRGFFHLRAETPERLEVPAPPPAPSRWQRIKNKTISKLGKALFVGSLIAGPVALAMTQGLGDVLFHEGHRIMPYAAIASVFATFTAVGISFYSYLRNATIRDARVSGDFYKDLDEETTRLLKESEEAAQDSSEASPHKLETEILSEQIHGAAFSPKNLFRRIKKGALKLWYGYEALESRSEKIRNSDAAQTELSALQLFGVISVKVLRHVFYLPLQRGVVSAFFPYYLKTRALGGRARLDTWRDRAWWPSFLYYPFVAGTYGVGAAARMIPGVKAEFKPDQFWEQQDRTRMRLIEASAMVEVASSRAAKRLEIQKARELGVPDSLIASVFAVERHLHEEGEAWWERLQNRLPKDKRLSKEIYREIVRYGKEVNRISRRSSIFKQNFPLADEFTQQENSPVSVEKFIEVRAEAIQGEIREEMHKRQKDDDSPYYHSVVSQFRNQISHFFQNHHETFYRIGKSGENVTQAKSVLNLGSYPRVYLQDQLIITAQVVPMMLASGLDVDMTDDELFNGMAPVFLFLPSFLSSYGNSLSARSRLIDTLVNQNSGSSEAGYFTNVYRNFGKLPWKAIGLQSASLMDLRFNAHIMSGVMMVGLVVPVDLTLTALASQGGSLGIMPVAEKLAGRFANAVAGVSFNVSFGSASTPIYTAVLALRKSSGGMSGTGYKPLPLRNNHDPNRAKDTFAYAGFNAAVNSVYGFLSGQLVPHWSESIMIGVDQGLPEAVDHLVAQASPSDIVEMGQNCRTGLLLASGQ